MYARTTGDELTINIMGPQAENTRSPLASTPWQPSCEHGLAHSAQDEPWTVGSVHWESSTDRERYPISANYAAISVLTQHGS